MEGEKRDFRELTVSICSAISGEARFPPKLNVEQPKPHGFRNNLTALSRYRNLYFVAYGSEIHVYEPQFPSQRLLTGTDFRIVLPKTSPALSGFIDPRNPHAINHIVIGDLGNEEILVCACDDGDIIGYETRSIHRIMEKRSTKDNPGAAQFDEVRPFFMRNMGLSAWGVAVHTAARMIAVSSNTCIITVFAFALGERTSSESTSSTSDNEDGGLPHDIPPTQSRTLCKVVNSPEQRQIHGELNRSGYQELILSGHVANVPDISFFNSGGDLTGRYLVSTDIFGEVIVWDIWARAGYRTLRPDAFIETHGETLPGGTRLKGWSVLCISNDSFRLAEEESDLCGCEPQKYEGPRVEGGHRLHGGYWDISGSRSRIRDSSTWHHSFSRYNPATRMDERPRAPTEPNVLLRADMSLELSEEDLEYDEEDDDEMENSTGDSWDDEEDLEYDLGMDVVEDNASHDDTAYGSSQSSNPPNVAPPSSSTRPPPQLPSLGHTGRLTLSTEAEHIHPELELPPFNILHASDTSLTLLGQSPNEFSTVLNYALEQNLPPQLGVLLRFRRLNMTAHIPELGVVLVASQIGRVAVLTTTRLRNKNGWESKNRKIGGPESDKRSFRLDWILPFKSQEDRGERPDVPLLGMAVGPIQGRMVRPEEEWRERWRVGEGGRRYRLMLTYYDNTVLGYELARKEDGEQVGNELLIF